MDVQINAESIAAAAAFVTAVGGVIAQIRGRRRDRRDRRKELEKVARAAASSRAEVAAVVDELETTGTFQRPTPRENGNDG